MRKRRIGGMSLLCLVLGGFVIPVSALPKPPRSPVDYIRQEPLQLPYYGVFDFLSFNYDKATVDLMGYAYRPTLKYDAEGALKRAVGVAVVSVPGTEPAGDDPIHIIVKHGRITLLGAVDSQGDTTVAGMRARGVPGAFGVDNALMVDHPPATKSKGGIK